MNINGIFHCGDRQEHRETSLPCRGRGDVREADGGAGQSPVKNFGNTKMRSAHPTTKLRLVPLPKLKFREEKGGKAKGLAIAILFMA